MCTHVDRGRGSKRGFFLDVINGWPLNAFYVLANVLTLAHIHACIYTYTLAQICQNYWVNQNIGGARGNNS